MSQQGQIHGHDFEFHGHDFHDFDDFHGVHDVHGVGHGVGRVVHGVGHGVHGVQCGVLHGVLDAFGPLIGLHRDPRRLLRNRLQVQLQGVQSVKVHKKVVIMGFETYYMY